MKFVTFILAVENIALCFSINKNFLDLHVSTKSNKMKIAKSNVQAIF